MKPDNIKIPGSLQNVARIREALNQCKTECEQAYMFGVYVGFMSNGADVAMKRRMVSTGMANWRGRGRHVSE
jgi:hypothetical protein